jgi:hypothetical protein
MESDFNIAEGRKMKCQYSFPLAMCICLVGCCMLECVAPLDRNIKPYIAYWHKDGMTEERRLHDWVACGGSKNGSFGISLQDKLPGESQAASQNRQQTDFQRCMIQSGYRYTGNCSSEYMKARPLCGAP